MAKTLEQRIAELEKQMTQAMQVGYRAPGPCFCPASPAARQTHMERMREWPDQRFNESWELILDHRCPEHGERAQPRVWGRHRELVLRVNFRVWESLSVNYEVDNGSQTQI